MLFFPLFAAVALQASPASSPPEDVISQAARQPPRQARTALAQAGGKIRQDDARGLARLSRAWSDTVAEHPDPSDASARQAAQQALDLAEAAVRADPRSAQARLALAIACGKETDFVDSRTKVALARRIRAESERAIALDPQLALAYHVLGRWHLGMAEVGPFARLGARFTVGQLPPASMQEAVRNLAKAAELSPRTIAFHQYLAIASQAAGQRNEALRQWRIVRDLPAESREDEEAQRQARAALGR
ncbi:MAG: hypothetical protein PHQ12_06345 [Chthoniobacteraceae bacterium]|nr:hypothetical protein [Chthoniobacteraceae bacterium]